MDWIKEVKTLFPKETFSVSEEDKIHYGSDYTEDLCYEPEFIFFPSSTAEVVKMVRFCTARKVTITPRGAGTGLSGGCLPVKGGVVLSLERMNNIIDVDEANFQMTVEAGVINEKIDQAAAEVGLMYPVDPASRGSSFIGGNVAHSSGGPKAVKYGTTKDYILNLEVVTMGGEVIWTGSDTLKNSTGYNLTQLMIGSEGTLAIITKVVVKLVARPLHNKLLLASFGDAIDACKAVPKIMVKGLVPSALELMEREAVEISLDHLPDVRFKPEEDDRAFLLIEVDGNDQDVMMKEVEQIFEVLESNKVKNVLFAEDEATKNEWWLMRRSIGEMVKRFSIYKEEDAVVKRSYLPQLLAEVKNIGVEYEFSSICYGHAGDGNLHINIIKGEMDDERWHGKHLEEGIRKIFRVCKKFGGTISGEHGIGFVQKKYMNEVMSSVNIELMKGVKNVFDPDHLLNPEKIWE